MDDSDKSFVWYFAIGSMMNPNSLEARKLKPIESVPGEILNYKLYFFGTHGMAEAIEEVGSSFHGVLHKMSLSDMEALDKLEVRYIRRPANIKLYDGRLIIATVYCREDTQRGPGFDKPPTERYIGIMITGCQHYGVHQSHIDYLKATAVIPRRKPEEFCSIPVPESLPTWTLEEVAKGTGEDGNPLYFTLNGKVLEFIGEKTNFIYTVFVHRIGGGSYEIPNSHALYDPLYGTHEVLDGFTREHCAYIEDFHVQNHHQPDVFRVVALFPQRYAD
eukprot:gene14902-31642_t